MDVQIMSILFLSVQDQFWACARCAYSGLLFERLATTPHMGELFFCYQHEFDIICY